MDRLCDMALPGFDFSLATPEDREMVVAWIKGMEEAMGRRAERIAKLVAPLEREQAIQARMIERLREYAAKMGMAGYG